METPTQPFTSKMGNPTPGDEPNLSTAIWAIGGFILFSAIIFILVVYVHF